MCRHGDNATVQHGNAGYNATPRLISCGNNHVLTLGELQNGRVCITRRQQNARFHRYVATLPCQRNERRAVGSFRIFLWVGNICPISSIWETSSWRPFRVRGPRPTPWATSTRYYQRSSRARVHELQRNSYYPRAPLQRVYRHYATAITPRYPGTQCGRPTPQHVPGHSATLRASADHQGHLSRPGPRRRRGNTRCQGRRRARH